MGFMSYLNDIDNNISGIEDVIDEDIIIEKQVDTVFTQEANKMSKDSTVELLEYRLKNKLDDVGLNSKVINEVINYVLGDVSTVTDTQPTPTKIKHKTKTKSKKKAPAKKAKVNEQLSLAERAASILDGVPDQVGGIPASQQSINETSSHHDLSDVADHASSLL